MAIYAGTPGAADWRYTNANPFAYGSPSWLNPKAFFMHEPEYKPSTDSELEALYAECNAGKRFDVTTYKFALYGEPSWDSYDPPGALRYAIYQNIDGSVERDYLGIKLLQNSDLGRIGWGEITNFAYPGAKAYGADDTRFLNASIPIFYDFDQMSAWLLSDSVNAEEYGAVFPSGNTPGQEEKEEEVEGDEIVGVSDFEGIAYNDGMLRLFAVNDTNYKALAEIVSKGAWGGNVGDAIVSIKVIKSPGQLLLQPEELIIEDLGRGVVRGQYLTKQFMKYELGSYYLEESFRNFLDYSHVGIELYLPYCGVQRLDPSIVIGTTLKLSCVLDGLSGNIVYFLEVEGAVTRTVFSWNGNCSIEVPITAEDYGRKVTALISAAGTVAATVVGSGIGALALGSTVASTLDDSSKYVKCGSITSNNGFAGIQYPFLIITKPKYSLPTNYGHTVGFMCMKTMSLAGVQGFTKVAEVHLEGITGATDAEISEIETLLKSGVVF